LETYPDDLRLTYTLGRALAAGKQYDEGMTNLGVAYETGQGVGKDESEAVRLYRKAADAGDARAMSNLGVAYWTGQGVGKDEAEATRLYRKAADAGNVHAMGTLGFMYEGSFGNLS
jgi:TPR repeat protein